VHTQYTQALREMRAPPVPFGRVEYEEDALLHTHTHTHTHTCTIHTLLGMHTPPGPHYRVEDEEDAPPVHDPWAVPKEEESGIGTWVQTCVLFRLKE